MSDAMSTSLPATRARTTFPEIAAVSWEHPADRAALQALRAVPGVDEVIRKVLALLGGERGIRLLFQGNAVRVGPTQFPKLWHLHTEACTTFDWPNVPELYVSQTPFFNAGAYGIDEPFIVLHSAAIELLDDDELRTLLAHELGHVMSGHALYRTIAAILAVVSLGALPVLASIAVLPIRLAFLEWSRKSELSADRAGLLGVQDILAAQRLDMKMAGGGRGEGFAGQMNVEAFMQQAHEYAAAGEGLDVVYKVLSTLALTHPMHTVRAAELQRWVSSGEYDRILRGEYVRRGMEQRDRPLRDDFAAAGNYYVGEARDLANQVAGAARRAADRAREAFRNAQQP
jgi:Zn-dependent protease with chaperone function